MNNQGWETQETDNQPRLKIFDMNLILTCNIQWNINLINL